MPNPRCANRPLLIFALVALAACGNSAGSLTEPGDEPAAGEPSHPGTPGTEPAMDVATVRTQTTGVHLDPDGYGLTIDGTPGPQIATTGTVSIPGLTAGTYSVGLYDVAVNCRVTTPNPQSITVGDPFETPSTSFYVACE